MWPSGKARRLNLSSADVCRFEPGLDNSRLLIYLNWLRRYGVAIYDPNYELENIFRINIKKRPVT